MSHLYSRTPVLRQISTSLKRGRCYLLLGENGAGKSTLLRVIAGLLRPSFGEVAVWGKVPEQARARIGYMAHGPMLYEELTAVENLRYFAALYASKACLAPDAALRAVALDPALTHPLRAYSQGMRQRVSLARVLLPRPDLLLLDEPFSNMDAPSAQAMLQLLAAERDSGATILLTTHQRELAEPLANDLLMLAEGELRAAV